MSENGSDIEKLKTLLGYWIEHNREHIAENRKWLQKAETGGLQGAAKRLEKVIELSEEVNHQMEHALEGLGGDSGSEASGEGVPRPHGHPHRSAAAHRGNEGVGPHGRSPHHHAHPHRHIELHQIGAIRTPYTDHVPKDLCDFEDPAKAPGHEAPADRGDAGGPGGGGREPGEESPFRIVLDEAYREGLLRLETLTYVFVLFHLDRSEGSPPLVVTPRNGGGIKVGVFASRSPSRPNRIGLSIVRVLGVSGAVVRISPIDVYDGTPLLDIKPYFGSRDRKPDAGDGWMRGMER